MNCSTTQNSQYQHFLTGNLGASIFIIIYIGLYGTGIIIYFACQFTTDTRDNREDEVSPEFFLIFHQINERQDIYNKLKNKEWVKKLYMIYYSDEPFKSLIAEQKAKHCSEKYQMKIQNLQLKHTYYVTKSPTPCIN
ncbi:unnamed protein product [Adineta steineri]|uniref:Transmembrane protein n=1 Tax=Adineta steineri TaxID=433720 RepID=A0A813T7T9_9BILA|nr:unnamed protein product [Adineta steineri]CAF3570620.1 unnamed protein product [Adineta steineri]